MKGCIRLILVLLVSVTALAQTSFDDHFGFARRGTLGPREANFAKSCGVTRGYATILYGESVGEGWDVHRTASVGNGRNDAEIDSFGTAELWLQAGKARLLNVWILVMDEGVENNELFCLDESGHVMLQQSLNSFQPVDGTTRGWTHLTTAGVGRDGRRHVLQTSFVNAKGAAIAQPRLGREELSTIRMMDLDVAYETVHKLTSKAR